MMKLKRSKTNQADSKHAAASKDVKVSGDTGARNKKSRYSLVIVVVFVGLIGTVALLRSFAATATSIYLQPATTTAQINSTFSEALRINPSANSDGVQVTVTYDPTKLQFISVDATNSAFPVQLQQSTTSNTITIIRALDVNAAAVTADSLVANLNFKALAGSGSSSITLSNASSSFDGNLTTLTTVPGTVNFTTPPPPAVTFSNMSSSSVVSTDLSIAAGQPNANLNNTTYVVTVVPVDNSGTGVKQVALQLDGGTAQTQTTGFSFNVNMSALSCGSHTLTATVTDNQSTPKTGTSTVTFKAARGVDVNFNCSVDLSDYNAVRSNFGVAATGLADQRIDVNRNGTVDLSDYSAVRTRFGT
jgi:hypothetical protein